MSVRRDKVRRALLAHYARGADAVALLATRGVVLLPGMELPMTVGRARTLRLAEWILLERPVDVGVRTQVDVADDDPSAEALPRSGIVAAPLRVARNATGTISLVLRGAARFRVVGDVIEEPFHRARIARWEDPARPFDASAKRLKMLGMDILAAPNPDARRARALLENEERPGLIADLVVGQLRGTQVEDVRGIAEAFDPSVRVELALDLIDRRITSPPPPSVVRPSIRQ